MPILWHASEPENGIVRVEINRQDRPVNVMSRGALEELAMLVDRISRDSSIRGVIFQSGKPGNFIAGADIEEFKEMNVSESAREASRLGQRVLESLEKLTIPTVAMISGACVGGGLEFVLACKYRIADDDRKTVLGLPEVRIGLIPGWGGTVRLPRLIGLVNALPMILTGQMLNARRAKSKGLVHDVVPREAFDNVSRKIIETGGAGLENKKAPLLQRLLGGTKFSRKFVLQRAERTVLEQSHGHYPAPLRAIDTIRVGVLENEAAQYAAESDAIAQLSSHPVTAELIRLFFVSEAAKKLPDSVASQGVDARSVEIKQAAVIGAGAMGAGIALLLAKRGVWTRLKDIRPEFVSRGMQTIRKLIRSDLQRKRTTPLEATKALDRLSPTHDYNGLKNADIVIEAIVEEVAVKRQVFGEIAKAASDRTVLATNTSSLRIAEIVEGLPNPERFVGLHFFNPPHQMPLVEVARGPQTSPLAVATAWSVVSKLGKTPVLVGDCTGFVVNRLLAPYMNETGYLLEEVDDPLEIERAAIVFGMPMGPLELMDLVGVEVAGHVSRNMHEAYGDRMAPAPLWTKLREGTGEKSAKPVKLYEKRFGQKKLSRTFRKALADVKRTAPAHQSSISTEEITDRLILPIINEAARCLDEGIVEKPEDVNLAMVFGTGFAPFRGGPLRYAESIGYDRVVKILERLSAAHPRLAPSDALRRLARGDK
ncbi:MAG: 3-hydroxyacyl-CoA dehydrogenase NAD-binding domain-containing protein [Planctomycetaceae bacterium]